MGKETIVSKGKYTYVQPAEAVSLKQYLFVRGEDGKKKLLLRFANDRAERCRGFAFVIYRLDAKGGILGEERYDSTEGKEYSPRATFSWDRSIEVEEKCTDFRIRLLHASYGNYTYRFEDDGVEVVFERLKVTHTDSNAQAEPEGLVGTRKRTSRSPWLYVAIALVAMAVAFAVFGVLLRHYINSNQAFSIEGMQYEFVNGDKETGDVIVTGYRGISGSLLIPSTVEGNRVVGIRENAFADNGLVQRVRVEGIAISTGAFRNCRNLLEVQLEGVGIVADEAFYNCDMLVTVKANGLEAVGQRAFADCERLHEVELTHTDPETRLTVGLHAFAECGMLTKVSIKQTIVYPQFQSIFRNDYNLQQLHLKNFAYTLAENEAKQPAHKGTVSMLFSDDGTLARPHQLTTLSIDYIDGIASQFCKGFIHLSKVEINCSEVTAVGEGAFSGCIALSEIKTPVPLTALGNEAFAGTALTYFDGSALVSIGEAAFRDCVSLADVNVKSGTALTTIGAHAFSGCASLVSFVIADEITELPAFLFSGCKSLATVTFDQGSALTAVGESSFRACTALRSISLPGGLLTIGENAFAGCSLLGAISVPASLTTYGNYAFYQCTSLSAVPFGAQLKRIGSYAFCGTALLAAEIPSTVEEIGLGAFMNCESLSTLTLPFLGSTAAATPDQRHISYLFGSAHSGQMGLVPGSLATVTLNAPITVLDPYAFFSCTGLRTVRFAATVSEIGEFAFSGCTSLSDFDFSAVTVIDQYAFSNTAFVSLNLPASITSVGEGAFKGCAKLKTATLPQEWSMLPAHLFAECGNLTGVTLPAGVTAIPDGCFYKCESLVQIDLPTGLQSIGADAFGYCTDLTAIALPDGLSFIGTAAFAASGLTSLRVPVSVQHISGGAFARCTALSHLTVPFVGEEMGLEQPLAVWFDVGSNSQLPRNLTHVTIDNPNGVTVLSDNFRNAQYLKEVVLREGVVGIDPYAFDGCKRLYYVSLPATLSYASSDAFRACYHLYEIDNYSKLDLQYHFPFPLELRNGGGDRSPAVELNGCRFACYNGTWYLMDYGADAEAIELTERLVCNGSEVTSWRIPEGFAHEDGALRSVSFFEGLTEIGDHAFRDCYGLGSVTLPATLEKIGDHAFFGCNGLYDVYNRSSLTFTEGASSYGYVARYAVAVHTGTDEALSAEVVLENGLVFRNSGSKWLLIAYRGTSEQLTLGTLHHGLTAIDAYRIAENAFSGNGTVRYLTVGNEVKQIQQYAFANCSGLREVSMSGNALKELEPYTFYQCQKLRKITMAEGIGTIGEYAFYYCNNLESVVMPADLSVIGDSAFASCSKLISVTIPAGVRSIGSYAFSGCKQLFEVYDLSSHLHLVKGSEDHGEVARYAAEVYTSTAKSLPRLTIDDCYFIQAGNVWYLYSCTYGLSRTVLTLPDGPSGGYKILARAFTDATFSGVVVPTQVTNVSGDAFRGVNGFNRIYYKGDSSKWVNVAPDGVSGQTYYYATCVHQPSRWTYRNGVPTVEYCRMSEPTVTNKPTCTRQGEMVAICLCEGCTYRSVSSVDMLPHEFEGKACTVCKKERTFITDENYAALAANGIIKNESTEPFLFDDGCFTSQNKEDNSRSEWSFTAKQRVKLSFTCGVSSEANADFLVILVDGVEYYRFSGIDQSDEAIVDLELYAGQTVTFVYRKDSSASKGQDEAYVKDVYYYYA